MSEEIVIQVDEDLVEVLLAHFEQVQAQPGALPITPEQCLQMLVASAIKEIADGD